MSKVSVSQILSNIASQNGLPFSIGDQMLSMFAVEDVHRHLRLMLLVYLSVFSA
jgi:hypothetical protein